MLICSAWTNLREWLKLREDIRKEAAAEDKKQEDDKAPKAKPIRTRADGKPDGRSNQSKEKKTKSGVKAKENACWEDNAKLYVCISLCVVCDG